MGIVVFLGGSSGLVLMVLIFIVFIVISLLMGLDVIVECWVIMVLVLGYVFLIVLEGIFIVLVVLFL